MIFVTIIYNIILYFLTKSKKKIRKLNYKRKGKLKRNHKKPEKSKSTLRISNKLSYKT